MYKMLVIGLSAGGIPLVKRLLTALPKDYSLAVVIVAHLPAQIRQLAFYDPLTELSIAARYPPMNLNNCYADSTKCLL